MKETKIKEKNTVAQNCNQSTATPVGVSLVSTHNKTNCISNKPTANDVGVGALGDPQTKNISRKFIANVVEADDPVRPPFEDQTQNKKSSKTYSNLISNLQSLTSFTKGITLIALIITIIVMLILVGVTVSIALNGGLIGKAQDAKSKTEAAMRNEQNIGEGRIKIDGIWYDSIQDYVNGKKSLNQGEEIQKFIQLDKDTIEIDKNGTETLTATLTGVSGQIEWESSEENIATVDPKEGNTVTITGIEVGKTIITAKCGEEYKAECKITVNDSIPLTIGAFVNYNVEYKDFFHSDYLYTKDNGWRYIGKDDEGNNLIMSTGIPANMDCVVIQSRLEGMKTEWLETDNSKLESFKEILKSKGTKEYAFYEGEERYWALETSAGAYNYFGEKVKFHYGQNTDPIGENDSRFVYVKNGTVTYDSDYMGEATGDELFNLYKEDGAKVRLLTLPELNIALGRRIIDKTDRISIASDSTGLYRLDQLKNISKMSTFVYESNGFTLASPFPAELPHLIVYVSYDGTMDRTSWFSGIRPVVVLPSDIPLSVIK